MQMLKLYDIWTNLLEKGGQIDVIYTDFAKAFDKVPHRRLLSKLSSYGVDYYLMKWIKGFLCDRMSRVHINGQYSD
jgi:ribonuclease P/MRP protein subunit RPP40